MALAAQVSKSPFATLLKRSKFSSFDPTIAQVYTTHGGDAYRGNWGFKRPLPLRRRGAYITVKAVDTLEQQTEWNSAEPQASWMKNWDELQMNPETPLTPTTRSQRDDTGADMEDSEYAPYQSDYLNRLPFTVPNIHAMSNTEFKQYLVHIRRQRGNFFAYKRKQIEKAEAAKKEAEDAKEKEKAEASGENVEVSKEYVEASNETSEGTKAPRKKRKEKKKIDLDLSRIDLNDFAVWESQKARQKPWSCSLESVPHSSAGLHYSHFTPLQTFLSTKERKGRIVEEVKGEKGRPIYLVASYAGMGTVVRQKKQGVTHAMVWGDATKTGVTKFRPDSVILERAPEVVGKRQGLKAAKISVDASACDAESHSKSDSHRPGSLEYIAAEPKSFANYNNYNYNSLTARPKRWYDNVVEQATDSTVTLDILDGLLKKGQKP
ncbi:hypothetical protein M405DRAFT_817587 [Rhizopogon salebrosus TDB-379]|nr:hypothetical protein M405DRAFT_817587 [Rhizopogon salebrosus TDB-379]